MTVFDPEAILRTLASHEVRFVLVGATAARVPTIDSGRRYHACNRHRKFTQPRAAMRALKARVYTESVPEGLAFEFDHDPLARSGLWNLITDAGRVDLIFKPSGTDGFEDLAQGAINFRVFGIDLCVASLEDIVRSKRASNRPQDQRDVIVLMPMLERQ